MKFNPNEYKLRNIAIWNEVAPRYHKRWASVSRGPFQSTSELIHLLEIKKGDRIFDLACGTGVVTKKINQKVGNSGYVIGADTSITAIKTAKKWIGSKLNLDFVIMDAENCYFAKPFDVITCQYALFFFPNAQNALKNIRKNLNKNGKLGISVHGVSKKVPFFSSILDVVTEFIPDYIPPGSPNLDRFGTKTALRNEVKKAGFEKIKVKNFVFKFNPGTFENYWKNYLRYVAKPLKEKLNSLDRQKRVKLKNAVRENVKSYILNDKTMEFPWEVLILTAKK